MERLHFSIENSKQSFELPKYISTGQRVASLLLPWNINSQKNKNLKKNNIIKKNLLAMNSFTLAEVNNQNFSEIHCWFIKKYKKAQVRITTYYKKRIKHNRFFCILGVINCFFLLVLRLVLHLLLFLLFFLLDYFLYNLVGIQFYKDFVCLLFEIVFFCYIKKNCYSQNCSLKFIV